MPSLLQNTNNAFQLTNSTESCMNGGGYGVTMESLANDANNHQGHNRVTMVPYSNCGKQGGGGSGLGSASHALNFNHQGAASYGFDEQGAAVSNELRGSYAAMTQHNNKQHCGGKKRRRRRRRKKTNKKRKSYRKSKKSKRRRKSRKKSRKSKKSRRRVVRRKRKTKQRGGSSITYMTLDKSLSGNNARLFSNHSYTSSNNNCGDGYNHYTGGKTKTLY